MTSDLSNLGGKPGISKASEGVLNIDKPGGMTSHDVVNRIRRLSGIRRVGHAGTLDPLATGVLLVCIGRATRLVEYLVGQPKVYETTIRMGQSTNTYDADGEVLVERPLDDLTPERLIENLAQFRGVIQQMPPMYSAIKKDGQPLYKLARKGIEVERAAREVTIYELELLAYALPDVRLRVTCSSGTYIRALAHDLGESLGCGGHILTLRRTAVGDYSVREAAPLQELDPALLAASLQPSDSAVAQMTRLDLSEADTQSVLLGQRVARLEEAPRAALVRAYDPAGRFIGILAEAEDQSWQPHKIFHPITEK